MTSTPTPDADNERTLKLRRIALDTHGERVAVLNRRCALFHVERFQALARLEVRCGEQSLIAVLVIADDAALVDPDEVGLSAQCLTQLGASEGDRVAIHPPPRIPSLSAIRRKIGGEVLGEADYRAVVEDIVSGQYSKTELTAFVVACAMDGLERDEVVHLTRAMADAGRQLTWPRPLVVDKHCIGGIPGNRTSMVVVPIVAAHGLLMPKTSSRAITSPAGTADTMECLARVDLTLAEMRAVVETQGACICWGGAMALSPADDILISVERPLSLDAETQMVASIISKKVAAGSTHVLLDIPVGATAKVRSMERARRLAKLFRYVAGQLGLTLEVATTAARHPIGRGVGPALEARDVMQVLRSEEHAPRDLLQKSLELAGRVIEFDPDVPFGQGYALAREILESQRALDVMQGIVQAQGPRPMPELGRLTHEVCAPGAGRLAPLDNFLIARLARAAGAPFVRGAGVDVLVAADDRVTEGQPVLRVHAGTDAELGFAIDMLEAHPDLVTVEA
ncbi:MAG: thymidine phosphorylase family protein [Planctomycetota bacterium]|nr:thymidine phosphorylase family protein [Planctomycetota bacterium]